jgi:hypothetical protein
LNRFWKKSKSKDGDDKGSENQTVITLKGELFGKVAATEEIIDNRRRKVEHDKKVQEIDQEQRNHIQLLQHRGQQIDALSNGAQQLNDAALNYATMAQQIKDKSKRQHDTYNKWFPFG